MSQILVFVVCYISLLLLLCSLNMYREFSTIMWKCVSHLSGNCHNSVSNHTSLQSFCQGWSGGVMVVGKLSVHGHPTIWIIVRQGPTACSWCGWGLFGHFYSHLSLLSSFSPLLETARYRLKYCLKGPLNPPPPPPPKTTKFMPPAPGK